MFVMFASKNKITVGNEVERVYAKYIWRLNPQRQKKTKPWVAIIALFINMS